MRGGQIVGACTARGYKGVGSMIDGQLVAHTLTSEGADASEDGTGRGSPIVTHPTLTTGSAKLESGGRNGAPPILIPTLTASGGQRLDRGRTGPEALVAATLCAGNPHRGGSNAKTQAENLIVGTVTATGGRRVRVEDARSSLVVSQNQRGEVRTSDIASALVASGGGKPGQGYQLATQADALRRLTPYEWALLQGFPPHWTCVHKGYVHADLYGPFDECPICVNGPDAHRYHGIGNAVSVPVVGWILSRINEVDS